MPKASKSLVFRVASVRPLICARRRDHRIEWIGRPALRVGESAQSSRTLGNFVVGDAQIAPRTQFQSRRSMRAAWLSEMDLAERSARYTSSWSVIVQSQGSVAFLRNLTTLASGRGLAKLRDDIRVEQEVFEPLHVTTERKDCRASRSVAAVRSTRRAGLTRSATYPGASSGGSVLNCFADTTMQGSREPMICGSPARARRMISDSRALAACTDHIELRLLLDQHSPESSPSASLSPN